MGVATEYHQADQLILSADLPTAEREKLIRLATRQDLPVKTIRDSETLARNGGVGCLLRYASKFDGQGLKTAGLKTHFLDGSKLFAAAGDCGLLIFSKSGYHE
jgi:hypothetical protein